MSPAAKTLGTFVRICSSTLMPRSVCTPEPSRNWVLGGTPVAAPSRLNVTSCPARHRLPVAKPHAANPAFGRADHLGDLLVQPEVDPVGAQARPDQVGRRPV